MMVCATYVMMPMDVKVGDLVSVKTLQSVASRALRCADVVHVMAPYSRGFSANLRGVLECVEMVPLTQRAYTDLWMWRVAMKLGFEDRRWLCVPIAVPLLHRYRPGEDGVQRAYRQSAASDQVLYVDACTSHGHGMGFYSPGVGWNSFSFPALCTHRGLTGEPLDVDINVLEYVAAILGFCAVLPSVIHTRRGHGDINAHIHVHIWTDNSSCMAWMLMNRVAHPLHLFLCQVLSLLRVLYHITLTVGHIPGVKNVVADAASRQFDQPERDGPVLDDLRLLPRLPLPIGLMRDIERAATPGSETTWTSAHAVLTALAGVRGWLTLRSTSSTRRC